MCKRHKKDPLDNEFTRRSFVSSLMLGGTYLSMNPFQVLFQALINGVLMKAAHADSITNKKLLVVALPGAPALWHGLSFIRPNGASDNFIRNNSVNNWIPSNVYSGNNADVAYMLESIPFPGGNIQAPAMWNRNIPVVGGGWTLMHQALFPKLMLINCKMAADQGHDRGPAQIVRPDSTKRSLHGILGDLSPYKIPVFAHANYGTGLGDPRYGGFKSNKSSVNFVRGNSPLETLMSAFRNTHPNVVAQSGRIANFSAAFRSIAVEELKKYAEAVKPGSGLLYENLVKAQDLFAYSFGDLAAQYNALHTKYADLETRCATNPVNNMIPPTGTLGGYNPAAGGSTGAPELFAVAEYLFKNDFSSAGFGALDNAIHVANLQNYTDEHRQNISHTSIVTFNYQFRVLAAMLNGFKDSLGPKFQEVTVFVGPEYNRSPQHSQQGTDHNVDGNTFAIFGGTVNGPQIIGNTKVNSGDPSGNYLGTYGSAGPTQTSLGILTPTHAHAVATLAAILGIEAPTSDPPLVDSNGQSIAERIRNV